MIRVRSVIPSVLCRAQLRLFASVSNVLKLDVGGLKYYLSRDTILKYPGSFFDTEIKKVAAAKNDTFVKVARNGELFKHVNAFLVSGSLPRNISGFVDLDQKTLEEIRKEARFYNIGSLLSACDIGIQEWGPSFPTEVGRMQSNCFASVVDCGAPAVSTLCQLWNPLVKQGNLKRHWEHGNQWLKSVSLFKETSLTHVDIEDLINVAKRIPSNEQGRYRIGACLFADAALEEIIYQIDVANLFPEQLVTLKAREMVIYTSECRKPHRYNRSAGSIGAVEVLLNSAFTGGELQVRCDDEATDLKTEPYSWVAVHADAACSINPMTSGARVSLLFDIIPIAQMGKTLLMMRGEMDADSYQSNIVSDVRMCDSNFAKLSRIAAMMKPELAGQSFQYIEPYFLNAKSVTDLLYSVDVSEMFPNKRLDIRPVHLVVQKETQTEVESQNNSQERGKGYLGTLVVVLASFYGGGKVRVSRGSETKTIDGGVYYWYAYRADATHIVEPIQCGERVTMEYDIYDAGSTKKTHEPFSTSAREVVSRARASECVRAEVQAAVKAALSEADAVVITLQHAYPDGVQLEGLRGGDRALYDTLTDPAGSSYAMELVNVILQYKVDPDTERYVLDSSAYSSCSANASVRENLIIPTKLTEQHRSSLNVGGLYNVWGLRVSQRNEK